MPNPKGKKSFRAWLDLSTMDMINNNYKKVHCRSRSQYIDRAIDFYTGYINSDNESYYIPKAIFSNLKGIVDLATSQINRMEFRNCVELAMIESILAVTHIQKGRFSFRLTAPYSEQRRKAASEAAKKNSVNRK